LGRAQRRFRRRLRRARATFAGPARRAAGRRAFAAARARLQRSVDGVPGERVVIETERLIIRAPRAYERPQMFALFSNPANERASPDADAAQVRRWAYGVPWGVWELETGELVGDCSLH